MPSVAGIKAGNAYVVIGAIDDVGKTLAKIGRRISSWGRSLTGFGMDTLFKTAFASFPGVAMVKWATTFEDHMMSIKAKIGATEAEMAMLRQTAMSAGKDIGITANQVAEIMLELSTRGKTAAEINDLTRPIALLAKATGSGDMKDMQQSAALMVDTLNAYHIPAKDAAKITDQLAIAANKSSLDLESTAVALSHIAAAGAQFGVPLTELIGMVAVLKNIGITAETAAIAIRNIQLRTANFKLGQEFNDSLKGYGIGAVTFADATGKMKQPAELMFDIFDKIKSLGNQAQVNILGDLFGTRAFVPAAGLGGQKAAFTDLVAAMEQVNGNAQKIALEMEAGIGGAFRRIKTATETLAIQFTTSLTPVLTALSQKILTLVNVITQWVSIHPRLTAVIASSVLVIMGLSVSLIITGVALKLFGIAMTVVGLGIMALRTAFTALWLTVQFGVAIFTTLLGVLPAVITFVVTAIFSLAQMLISVVTGMVAFIASINLVTIGAAIFQLVGTLALIVSFVALGVMLFDILKNVAIVAFNAIGDLASRVGKYLSEMWTKISEAAQRSFGVIKEGLTDALKLAAMGNFRGAMEVALASLKVAWLELRNIILDMWDDIYVKVGNRVNQLITMFRGMVIDAKEKAYELLITTSFAMGGMTEEKMNEQFDKLRKNADEARKKNNIAPLQGEGADAKEKREKQLRRAIGDVGIKEAMNNPDTGKAKGPQGLGVGANVPPFERFQGQTPAGIGGTAHIAALDALDKFSTEAAKAAYENQMNTNLGERMLNAVEGIEVVMNGLNEKLQVVG